MSDTELRLLRRFLSQNPDDYAVWGQYLQAGARAGVYDPNNWNASVTWITGVSPAGTGPNYDQKQAQLRNEAEDRVIYLLHQIRNTQHQLSASVLAPIIDDVLSKIYARGRKVLVAAPEEYSQFPTVIVDDTYRILYDEQYRHTENRKSIRREKFMAVSRSILDAISQYLIETDLHHPGSRDAPPDSEPITLDIAGGVKELITKLVNNIENEENQEIFYDEREEEMLDAYEDSGYETMLDTTSQQHIQGTFQRLKNCLDGLFPKYRLATYGTAITLNEDFQLTMKADSMHLEVTKTVESYDVLVVWAANNVVSPGRARESFLYPWQIIDYAWKSWMAHRLEEVLRLLQENFLQAH